VNAFCESFEAYAQTSVLADPRLSTSETKCLAMGCGQSKEPRETQPVGCHRAPAALLALQLKITR
jgi:hypothetical protein